MAASTAAVSALSASDGRSRRGRLLLAGGVRTTIHVACHDAARTEIRVAVLPGQERLEPWCVRHGVREALVGGFFTRPAGTPLGEVRTHGVVREHVPFDAPWHAVRACVHVEGGEARIALADGRILAVVCDGRSRHDVGLTLHELARLMVALGCSEALNLDGGGSAALISGGRVQNLPRGDFETPEPGGRPISAALEFRPA